MLLYLLVFLLICCSNAFAEKNFWDNDICTADSDCSGLTECHSTFGCTLSVAKVSLVFVTVIVSLVALCIAGVCLCQRRGIFARPTTQYIHRNPVIVTNPPPLWNQQQMGTTVGYPYHLNQNQFYPSAGTNPPNWNQYQVGQAMTVPPIYNHNQYPMGHATNANQAPRDIGFEYGKSNRSQYLKQQTMLI